MFTLIRQPQYNDWRQRVFGLLADYLRRRGITISEETSSSFRTYSRRFGTHEVEVRDSLAIIRDDCALSYWVLDCHDWTAPWDLHFFQEDLRCRRILKCQYRHSDLRKFRADIVRPWTYFDFYWPNRQEHLITLRKSRRCSTALYFRGNLWDRRKDLIEILQPRNILNRSQEPVPYEQYSQELASHHVVLSLPGCGEFCHRDIEAFATGACVLRPKVRNSFHDILTPDFHYVSVDVDLDREDLPYIATCIERKYREVAGNVEYLAYVGANAAAWYDRNVSYPRSMELTTALLGLD